MTIPSLNNEAAVDPFDSTNVAVRTPSQTLEQEDFLELLVAQMTNQDPLNPIDNMESFAQLAQFSALEQSKAMQANMAVLQANSLLGQQVQVKTDDGETVEGLVTEIQILEGTPRLMVNGQRFDLHQVQIVRPGTHNPNNVETEIS